MSMASSCHVTPFTFPFPHSFKTPSGFLLPQASQQTKKSQTNYEIEIEIEIETRERESIVMKLVWCPDTASKAYIDAVHSLSGRRDLEDSNVAELVAAMAGGWKAQLVVEACSRGDSPATSLALAAALKHTRGRRVVVPADFNNNNNIDSESTTGEEIFLAGEAEAVDFMVVDMRRRDAWSLMREARAGPRGMVLVCKNVEKRKGGVGTSMVGKGLRVVRSAYLPIGRGVEILHVGVGKGPRLGAGGCSRWFKHVDRVTGEEHLFRK